LLLSKKKKMLTALPILILHCPSCSMHTHGCFVCQGCSGCIPITLCGITKERNREREKTCTVGTCLTYDCRTIGSRE
jgi:hypothetical protein